jgi:hypothetical protein
MLSGPFSNKKEAALMYLHALHYTFNDDAELVPYYPAQHTGVR